MIDNKQVWIDETYEKVKKKMYAQANRMEDLIPYIPEDGRYVDMGEDIVWWTNGFWSGMLWLMFNETGDELFKQVAEANENRLDLAFDTYKGLHHDVGFMWLHSSVANYRLTGNERSLQRSRHAADLLAARFNPMGKYLRSWNNSGGPGAVIIDSLMNVPLLFWAFKETSDPRFEYMAVNHLETLKTRMIRADGSCNHIIDMDPYTGEVLETPRGQGYASGSAWTRGQAWGIYGYSIAYKNTGNKEYLDIAKRIAYYFISQVKDTDYIPKVDFRQPNDVEMWDTSAATCAAAGMIDIAEHLEDVTEKEFFMNEAFKLLYNNVESYANFDVDQDSILDYATGSYHEERWTHVPIIYGDFFLIEALLKWNKKSFEIW